MEFEKFCNKYGRIVAVLQYQPSVHHSFLDPVFLSHTMSTGAILKDRKSRLKNGFCVNTWYVLLNTLL